MRIAFNGFFLDKPNTGSGQYARSLLAHLAQIGAGLDCRVYRPPGVGAGDAFGPFAIRHLSGPPGRNAGKIWFEQASLPRAAARVAVDLIHYPYFAAPLISSSKVVVTVHDLITLLFPEYQTSLAARLYNRLIARAVRRAVLVIADSESTRRDIVRRLGLPDERIRVIYLAVEGFYRPCEDASLRAGIREKYGLGQEYILYIGGFNAHKNLGKLLEAFALVLQALGRRFTLAIAGAAHSHNPRVFPDWQLLARQLAVGDSVKFLGFIPEGDKPPLYSAASLFVYPSLYEGFGLTPLEAMACGAPVICSRAASLPEVVGEGGILVDVMEVRELASAMTVVLSDPNKQAELRYRGTKQAQRFSWPRTANQTLEVYREASRSRAGKAG
ncbi:MAG: glycosyltransferase family 1 protein [Chloroflexota bacterium]